MISTKLDETKIHVSKGVVRVTDLIANKRIKLKRAQIIVINSEIEEVSPMQQKFAKKDVVETFGDLQTSFISYKKSQTDRKL